MNSKPLCETKSPLLSRLFTLVFEKRFKQLGPKFHYPCYNYTKNQKTVHNNTKLNILSSFHFSSWYFNGSELFWVYPSTAIMNPILTKIALPMVSQMSFTFPIVLYIS